MKKNTKSDIKKKILDHQRIEHKWQVEWFKKNIYVPSIKDPESKYYNLFMFPYPSAEGLHAGHAFSSTGSDVYGRFKRMNGYDVFQPIGYDSFGIHSENYAIKIKKNPKRVVDITTKNYERQLKSMGHGYDWTRTVTTSDIDYYRWTQWLFVQLFKLGLAYRKKTEVNWCPSCKTVLADEQVTTPAQAGKEPKDAKGNTIKLEEGMQICERCGTLVEKKKLEQWLFRITDYADKLLANLDKIDWPDKIKLAQRNWIGRSEGSRVIFQILKSNLEIEIFTTRPDTLFGVTFMVVSPEYAKENLLQLINKENIDKISKYINISLKRSKIERGAIGKEKSGVDTGLSAINPVNSEEIPIFVADYVLTDYGTGAIMGVPAHDERDFAFAKKYSLPIRKVIDWDDEIHSLVIKKSVDVGFESQIKKYGWFITDYEGWGWGIVVPEKDSKKYIEVVQTNLVEGPWYVDTDGSLRSVIFKDRFFKLPDENYEAKYWGERIGIPEGQLDWQSIDNYSYCYTKKGRLINSKKYDGLSSDEASEKLVIENKGIERETNYHLRDWLISRQRYWGPPIPMIYCETCAKAGKNWFDLNRKDSQQRVKLIHAKQDDWDATGWFPEENLPVALPDIDDYEPEGEGKGPLANHPEFYEVKCPNCGLKANRETDVSDTFLDSSWYFMRYPSVSTEGAQSGIAGGKKESVIPWSREITRSWLPVDLYFGGAEHAVLHLMYARFVTMALFDAGYLDFDEPFPWFYAHGLMIKDGAKMSKSRGNIVNPDEYIKKYGADTLRMYSLFLGPMDGYPDFRDTGIEGMRRFIEKVWKLFSIDSSQLITLNEKVLVTKMNQTIKKVTEDIEYFRYNTAIAAIMEFVNLLRDTSESSAQRQTTQESEISADKSLWTECLSTLAKLLAPFAPHMTEEVWVNVLQKPFSVHLAKWPTFDPKLVAEEEVIIPVQINGKLRATLKIDSLISTDKKKVIDLAKNNEKIQKWLEAKEIKKEIFVPGKLVNLVI